MAQNINLNHNQRVQNINAFQTVHNYDMTAAAVKIDEIILVCIKGQNPCVLDKRYQYPIAYVQTFYKANSDSDPWSTGVSSGMFYDHGSTHGVYKHDPNIDNSNIIDGRVQGRIHGELWKYDSAREGFRAKVDVYVERRYLPN